jgi:DNA-directed RNA polymerase subunit F
MAPQKNKREIVDRLIDSLSSNKTEGSLYNVLKMEVAKAVYNEFKSQNTEVPNLEKLAYASAERFLKMVISRAKEVKDSIDRLN